MKNQGKIIDIAAKRAGLKSGDERAKTVAERRARDILLFKRPVINRVTWSDYGSPYFSWLDDQKDAEAEDQG